MNGDVIIQRVCEHRLILKEASVFDFRFLDSKFQCIRAIDFRVVCPNFVFIFRRSRKVSKGIEMVFVNVFLGLFSIINSLPACEGKCKLEKKNLV